MAEYRCPQCGYDGGGSHYHCPECGGVCSLMGHRPSDCEAYLAKRNKKMGSADNPKSGTWDTVVRSETPMPYKKMLEIVTFTPEELIIHMNNGTFIDEQMKRTKKAMELMEYGKDNNS